MLASADAGRSASRRYALLLPYADALGPTPRLDRYARRSRMSSGDSIVPSVQLDQPPVGPAERPLPRVRLQVPAQIFQGLKTQIGPALQNVGVMTSRSRLASAVAVLAILAAACGSNEAKVATGTSTTSPSTTSPSPSAGPQLTPGGVASSSPPTASASTTATVRAATTTAGATATTAASTTSTRATTTTTRSPTTTKAPTTTTQATTSAQGKSGGLSVSLTATPSNPAPGSRVAFTVKASESHAPGALAYQMTYGDGLSDQNNVPAYCASGPGSPASQTWQLPHSYAKAGTYRATVTVKANCTADKVTLEAVITVS